MAKVSFSKKLGIDKADKKIIDMLFALIFHYIENNTTGALKQANSRMKINSPVSTLFKYF